jgi:hypothetical protein
MLLINGGSQITLDHNTVMNDGLATVYPYDTPVQGFVFTNNILADNGYGIIGGGEAPGAPTITTYFPNSVFLDNIIVGAPTSTIRPATTTRDNGRRRIRRLRDRQLSPLLEQSVSRGGHRRNRPSVRISTRKLGGRNGLLAS